MNKAHKSISDAHTNIIFFEIHTIEIQIYFYLKQGWFALSVNIKVSFQVKHWLFSGDYILQKL